MIVHVGVLHSHMNLQNVLDDTADITIGRVRSGMDQLAFSCPGLSFAAGGSIKSHHVRATQQTNKSTPEWVPSFAGHCVPSRLADVAFFLAV